MATGQNLCVEILACRTRSHRNSRGLLESFAAHHADHPRKADCERTSRYPHCGRCTSLQTDVSLVQGSIGFHGSPMFVVSEDDAATICAAFDRGGELAAAIELRRLFPAITDNEHARRCARTIAGWTPLTQPLRSARKPKPTRKD